MFGDRHYNVASTLSALARVAKEKRDLAGATTLLRQSLDIRRRHFGEGHPLVATTMQDLANVLRDTGDVAEATNLQERAVAILEAGSAAGPSMAVADSLHNRGNLLYRKGDLAGAEALLRQSLDMTRDLEGPSGRATGGRLLALGHILLARGDHASAESTLRDSLEAYRIAWGADHPLQLKPLRGLHRSLIRRGDRAAADAVYLDILRAEVVQATHEMRSLPLSPKPVKRRGQLLARLGRFEESAADRERVVQLDPADHDARFCAAIDRLYLGDADKYRAHARELLTRVGDAASAEVAERPAKALLLSPPADADLDAALALADKAVAAQHSPSRVAWFELTKALAEYRARRHASALEWLARFRANSPQIAFGDRRYPEGTGLAIAAMAHYRLGERPEAQRRLAEAIALSDVMPKEGDADLGPGADNWAVFQILLREAMAVVQPEADTPTQ